MLKKKKRRNNIWKACFYFWCLELVLVTCYLWLKHWIECDLKASVKCALREGLETLEDLERVSTSTPLIDEALSSMREESSPPSALCFRLNSNHFLHHQDQAPISHRYFFLLLFIHIIYMYMYIRDSIVCRLRSRCS